MNCESCSLSNLREQLRELSALMEEAFGYGGKSILFEHNGMVLTSKDGAEILSTIHLTNPVTEIVAKSAISMFSEYGDGSKSLVILCKNLFEHLERLATGRNKNVKRRRMINILMLISERILPKLQESSMYEAYFELNSSNKDKLRAVFYGLLTTKFCSNIGKIFSELLCKYLLESTTKTGFKEFLREVARKPSNSFVEIPDLPVGMSTVVEGFIITRNFKHLQSIDGLKTCSFILWSCPILKEDHEETPKKIQVNKANEAHGVCFLQMQLLTKVLSIMRMKRVCLIISSTYFPEWAISICMSFQISVVDMVNREEFEYLRKKTHLNDFTLFHEADTFNDIGVASFEKFHMANCKFIKIFMPCQQIVVTGPTLSKCRQYFKAMQALITYLLNWIDDSQSHEVTVLNKLETKEPIRLYFTSCGYSNVFKIYTLVNRISWKNLEVESHIMKETLKEILLIHYKQLSHRINGSFINFLTSLQDKESEQKHSNSIFVETSVKLCNQTIENPFLMFKTINAANRTLMQILKVEHVVKSRVKIKAILKSPSDTDQVFSQD